MLTLLARENNAILANTCKNCHLVTFYRINIFSTMKNTTFSLQVNGDAVPGIVKFFRVCMYSTVNLALPTIFACSSQKFIEELNILHSFENGVQYINISP